MPYVGKKWPICFCLILWKDYYKAHAGKVSVFTAGSLLYGMIVTHSMES
jgi:hypothetical protein